MPTDAQRLRESLDDSIAQLQRQVNWKTPRAEATPLIWQAIQACHAFHRERTPAYRDRCNREGIGVTLERDQLPLVVFPEEVWKGYSELSLPNGGKLGVFCEQDVPRLIEYLNQYLSEPIKLNGLARSYMSRTNLVGGLERLRADLLKSQGIILLTSSGTTGSAFSLIPFNQEVFDMGNRAHREAWDGFTDLPGLGPIDPSKDGLVAYGPLDGSMMMAVGLKVYAEPFGDRAALTIPARVYSRELRWRAGVFAGTSGQLLRRVIKPLMTVGGKRTAQKGLENTIAALKRAEQLKRRTLLFANQWLFYNALKVMQQRLEAEIAQGLKPPGSHYIELAPGSVWVAGGGNKSGLNISVDEIIALCHQIIGGIDRVCDGYGQSESPGIALQCPQGRYHLEPRMWWFIAGHGEKKYLASFDPRETYRFPALIRGDLVDGLYDGPCSCGWTSPYFNKIERDSVRGSKGCAAALNEYAV